MLWSDSFLNPLLKWGLNTFNSLNYPHTRGRLALKGLRGEVEIMRDVWGTPHIFGRSIEDVIFAQGFVHAQERLWQLDFCRRLVAGRLSEILGKVTLKTDIAMRTMGFRKWAEETAAALEGQPRAILGAFCEGVNACIRREPLPLEFKLLRYSPEPWSMADSLSWNYLLFLNLGASWESELLRGQLISAVGPEVASELELTIEEAGPLILDANLPSFQLGNPFTGPSRKNGVGSNNWVISGERSKSGMPLLANDMHVGMSSPAIFILNHLCCDELDVAGASFPGIPLVVQGHNGHVAWGFTNGFADVQDLYVEHLLTRDGRLEYELSGEWCPVTFRQEKILVKGEPAHTETVVETIHGPIINQALLGEVSPEIPPLAMRWTAFETNAPINALLRMNQAQGCQEFRDALREWAAPVQNVVFADTQNNIAFLQAGEIPIRARGDGSKPLPGWTGEREWVDRIPFDDLPQLYNPPRGYIVTANNRVAGSDYPYYLGHDYINADRAQRISELIEEKPLHDLSSMQKIQLDQQPPSARRMVQVVRQLQTGDPELAGALGMVAQWDGTLDAGSTPAAIVEVWVRQILALVLDGKLDGLEERMRGGRPGGLWGLHCWEWLSVRMEDPDSPWWKFGELRGRDAVMLEALRRTLAYLRQELGPDVHAWQWGSLHQLTFSHILGSAAQLDKILNLGPFPIGGDGGTVWAAHTNWYENDPVGAIGPPYRFVIDLADVAHAHVTFAPGQSGRPGTAHYADGIQDWFSGKYHPLLFLRAEIEHNAESRLTLIPDYKGQGRA